MLHRIFRRAGLDWKVCYVGLGVYFRLYCSVFVGEEIYIIFGKKYKRKTLFVNKVFHVF